MRRPLRSPAARMFVAPIRRHSIWVDPGWLPQARLRVAAALTSAPGPVTSIVGGTGRESLVSASPVEPIGGLPKILKGVSMSVSAAGRRRAESPEGRLLRRDWVAL